jgi:hypothetical protein
MSMALRIAHTYGEYSLYVLGFEMEMELNKKYLWILIPLSLLLLMPSVLSACPTSCPIVVTNIATNPCLSQDLNLSTAMVLTSNATACASGTVVGTPTSSCGIDCINAYHLSKCDNVSIRAVLYFGETFAQDTGWSSFTLPYQPSNSAFFDYLIPNTSGSYTLKVYAKSMNTSEGFATKTLNFTVVNSGGVVYGDCKYSNSFQDSSIPFTENNAIKKFFEGFGNTWTSNFIYILFMLIIGGLLWFKMSSLRGSDQGWLVASILVVECILAFIGAYIGAISWVFLILTAIGIVIYFTLKFTGKWVS